MTLGYASDSKTHKSSCNVEPQNSHTRWRIVYIFLLVVSLLFADRIGFAADKPIERSSGDSKDQVEFFEKHIRPILVDNCFECHAGNESKGGLRLDSKSSLNAGGDSGAIIEPGRPDSSLLIDAVRYKNHDLQMPPKNRLSSENVETLERWVSQGGVYPAWAETNSNNAEDAVTEENQRAQSKPAGMSIEEGLKFWSMQPVENPSVPTTKDPSWLNNPIDAFVLSKLEQAGLKPSKAASRRSLIRRVTFDLIGLPPTPAEVDAFIADDSPDAYSRVVDRLLDSPDYGIRWGRHWLDVARYADSNGLDENVALGNAWRYRDYVVDSFNRDKPFNQFLIEQIAGDLLPDANQETRTATGFLVLGAKVLAERDPEKLLMDTIDEQIDTLGKVFLGMTLGCARCHDHKFDPVKQSDYYRLAAIFKSTKTFRDKGKEGIRYWNEEVFANADEQAKIKSIDDEIAKKQRAANSFKSEAINKLRIAARSKATEYLVAASYISPTSSLQEISEVAHPLGLHPRILHHCRKHLDFNRESPFFSMWHELATHHDSAGIALHYRPLFEAAIKAAEEAKAAAATDAKSTVKLNDALLESAREALFDVAGFLAVPAKPASAFDDETLNEYYRLADEARILESHSPDLSAAMAVCEGTTLEKIPIHIRGSHRNLGSNVARGFPEVMCGSTPQDSLPKNQSGRLELAQWMSQSSHPLTARVCVNRIWGWHFGNAIVRTTENFGVVGERPTHPELLDWLASYLIQSDWSVKKLHRLILASRTYQMSVASDASSEHRIIDPENRLLSHFPMVRLDAEQIRDSILLIAGLLDRSVGGKTLPLRNRQFVFDHTSCDRTTYDSPRRSIYLPIIRNNLYSLFEQFDFPDPTMPTGHRNVTTVAPQSLFMMNSDLMLDASNEMAAELIAASQDVPGRLEIAFRKTLSRDPTDFEIAEIARFISDVSNNDSVDRTADDLQANQRQAWTLVCQSLFSSNEFFYLR
ncbi:MAG: PSD1 and planctomycete cytochrome C domain-containing protein [Planctomycetota bacterium]|nr:PSD1 and planctomycete cytochrome C domain-containing protein [Planctomycetota bacterium]